MPSDLKILVKSTSKPQRMAILAAIGHLGQRTELYDDESFEFAPHDNESYDKVTNLLDLNDTEYENV